METRICGESVDTSDKAVDGGETEEDDRLWSSSPKNDNISLCRLS